MHMIPTTHKWYDIYLIVVDMIRTTQEWIDFEGDMIDNPRHMNSKKYNWSLVQFEYPQCINDQNSHTRAGAIKSRISLWVGGCSLLCCDSWGFIMGHGTSLVHNIVCSKEKRIMHTFRKVPISWVRYVCDEDYLWIIFVGILEIIIVQHTSYCQFSLATIYV